MNIPATLNLTGDFTVSAWVRPTVINSGWNMIFAGNTSDMGFGYSSIAKIRLTDVNVQDASNVSSGVIPLNTWSQASVTFSNSSKAVAYYINGIPNGTTTLNQTFVVGNKFIGETSGYLSYFPGLIDDVRIYNRALSASEIQAMYNGGK